MHLSCIGMGEPANLQVDDHQASKSPVKEQQIHPIPLVTDAQGPLPAHEAEIPAEFQEEGLQAPDQCLSSSLSEYSSLRPRNSRTKGSLIASSGSTASRLGFVELPGVGVPDREQPDVG